MDIARVGDAGVRLGADDSLRYEADFFHGSHFLGRQIAGDGDAEGEALAAIGRRQIRAVREDGGMRAQHALGAA